MRWGVIYSVPSLENSLFIPATCEFTQICRRISKWSLFFLLRPTARCKRCGGVSFIRCPPWKIRYLFRLLANLHRFAVEFPNGRYFFSLGRQPGAKDAVGCHLFGALLGKFVIYSGCLRIYTDLPSNFQMVVIFSP